MTVFSIIYAMAGIGCGFGLCLAEGPKKAKKTRLWLWASLGFLFWPAVMTLIMVCIAEDTTK